MTEITAELRVASMPPTEIAEGHPALLALRDPSRIAALTGANDKISRRGREYDKKVIEGVFLAHDGFPGTSIVEDGYPLNGQGAGNVKPGDQSIQVIRFRPRQEEDAVSPHEAAKIGAIAVKVIRSLAFFDASQRDVGPFSLNSFTYLAVPEEYVEAYAGQAPGDHSAHLCVDLLLDVPNYCSGLMP